MNPFEAAAMFKETVNAMRAADPVAQELGRDCFMFEASELYQAMRQRYPVEQIVAAIETLAPHIETPSCDCGRSDPRECDWLFRDIVDDLYVGVATQ